MSRIDLSRVVNSTILADVYSIERSTGVFSLGGWKTTISTIPGYGVVSSASDEDLVMIPEADRVTGMFVFHSETRLFLTQLDIATAIQHVSDIIIWNHQQYRLLHVAPYNQRYYWRAIGARMSGQ
jgi:hypothetical protein